MQHYTYLIINLLTISICFIFSFHPKIKFNRYFIPFLKASILVAIPFIIWDAWFTSIGVWWFNNTYLLGLRIVGLPLEELLFFICIPFSCVFTYYCITKFYTLQWSVRTEHYFTGLSIVLCAVMCLFFSDKLYTFITFFITGLSLVYLKYIAKVDWICTVSLIYTILMPGFLMVNGVLTGTGLAQPIVNYNSDYFLNIRLGTIPIEDAVYGYTMIAWNIYFFKKFMKSVH